MDNGDVKGLIESWCSNRTFYLNQTNSKCGGTDLFFLSIPF